VGEVLADRRREVDRRLVELRSRLDRAEEIATDKACVYLTGSFGRGEASEHSDLDVFIVGRDLPDGRPALSRLEQICLKAELIHATRRCGFQPFSGDGQYLQHHTVRELTSSLGRPDDDASNTFTARLLLLLESRALLGPSVYDGVIEDVIAQYWRDYEDHKDDFVPAFLVNDILRLWRTFCVNYEASTQTDPPERKAKRRLKNYKLKHSRLLTCYSALAYLLAVHREKNTVTPEDAQQMVRLTPTDRLEWVGRQHENEPVQGHVGAPLQLYERFLEQTAQAEDQLVALFMDRDRHRDYAAEAREFGDQVFALLQALGEGPGRSFYRLVVV
jgi:predicted nucleotidyltransferase